jgi:hypothetical protein
MTAMPWFRFYSEAIHDTKLRRIARKTGVSLAETLGTWAVILAFASDSPQRGKLLLSDGNPVTEDDLLDVTGRNVSETLQQLQSNGMLTVTDGILCVANWDKRQYPSDNSTARVQKHREKARNVPSDDAKRYGNVTETPPETDTDSESDTDSDNRVREQKQTTETETETELPTRRQIDPEWARAIKTFEDNVSVVGPSMFPDMLDIWDTLVVNGWSGWWDQAVTVAVEANKRQWRYVRGILTRCMSEGHPPRNGYSAPKATAKQKHTVLNTDGTTQEVEY